MYDNFSKVGRQHGPTYSATSKWRADMLSYSLHLPLDRVNVLGDHSSGHTGCVNALSWARNGEILLSGGDDTTVRLWKIDPFDQSKEYPFVCDAVIRTGHRNNIFNAQLLPHSARLATVARDGQVRIADIGDCFQQVGSGREAVYTTRQTNLRVLRCHKDAVKRIITEESPDLFLTVSEDGTVRQHDLRVHHTCGSNGTCPTPLVQMPHELSTLALSPLTPYQLVVAGDSAYGYLFDRRQSRRHMRADWGMSPDNEGLTTCVRRFGREPRSFNPRRATTHITGARMAESNGHEVYPYSSDAIYLYSTRDDPTEPAERNSARLPSSSRSSDGRAVPSNAAGSSISDDLMEADIERFLGSDIDGESEPQEPEEWFELDGERSEVEDDDDESEYALHETVDEHLPRVPVVHPRARYAGACNVDTVKDVNFLGPRDEFVVSGSDDGYWFMWDKKTQKLHDILEGDGSVVNVIEGHPSLPLVAVSGIDYSVKLFAPAHGPQQFSRMSNAGPIVERNTRASETAGLTSLAMYRLLARAVVSGENAEGCEHQ
ncbi:WD40 repeat-like protein [Trametopsis cervina]|nr:WD40 repeat-like protein [Trametopsis cervina]